MHRILSENTIEERSAKMKIPVETNASYGIDNSCAGNLS